MFPGSTGRRQANDVRTLTGLRHDMKNQLGIILGFAELLLQELDSANPHRADVAEIREAASRAMELLNTLKTEEE